MARLLRTLAVIALVVVALPVQAAPPAPQGLAGPEPALVASAPDGTLQLALQVDPLQSNAGAAFVRLQLAAQVALQGLEVIWEAPEGVTAGYGTPRYPAALAAGEPVEWGYRVPVPEEGCGAFALWAHARTADGVPVQAQLRGWVSPGPDGYELQLDTPSEAAAAPAGAAPQAVVQGGGGGDTYESDDDPEVSANKAVVGTLYPGHNFHTDGDQDWVWFTAAGGKSYAIELLNLGCQCVPELGLYRRDGVNIYTPIHVETSRTFILWTAPAGGTYYVKVEPQEAARFGRNTTYSLRVRTFSNHPDAYEADNSPPAARSVVLGTSYRHTFHTVSDEDWVKVKGVIGRYYMADVLNLGRFSRPILSVYVDDGGGGIDLVLHGDQHVTWQGTVTRTYYIAAQNDPSFRTGDLMGPSTQYYLRVRTFTPAKDAYEYDDGYIVATPAAFGVRYRHNAHLAAEQDWMKIVATADTTYLVDLPYQGRYAPGNWMLHVRPADPGEEITYTQKTSLVWTSEGAGTYYLQMVHYPLAPFGPGSEYDLRITAPDAYEDTDNGWEGATPLPVGTTSPAHNILPASDADWFRFNAVAGKVYAFDALQVSDVPCIYLDLFGPGGVSLGLGGYMHVRWKAPTSNTYFVRARAPRTLRSYRLRLATISAPWDAYEPDGDFDYARPMAFGTAYKHDFHMAYDTDWMHFHATEGTSYAIRGRALGEYSVPHYMLDGSGAGLDYPGYGVAWGWTAPDTGTYYVGAQNDGAHLLGPGTEYDLRVVKYTPNTDSYEPDDTPATASTYAFGSRQAHTFHQSYDEDWVRVSLVADHQYRFETVSLGCGNATVVYLYSSADTVNELAKDDDAPGRASLLWAAGVSGTYYVKVMRYGGVAYGAGTEYDLRITDLGLAP